MIKKTTYILAAVIMSFATVILPASASEISGFVLTNSTAQSTMTTPTPSMTPSPTLTPTPSPSPASTSSEISGEVNSGSVQPQNSEHIIVANYWWDPSTWNNGPLTASVVGGTDATSTIDDPMKFLTPPTFGARYGFSDGATTTAGIGSVSSFSDSSGSGSDESLLTGTGGPDREYSLAELLPHSAGEIFGNGGNADTSGLEANTANALSSANGLSVMQLLYIAILALVVIASMGYAISRTAPHSPDVRTS